jgi:small subunit ribosomal protein S21
LPVDTRRAANLPFNLSFLRAGQFNCLPSPAEGSEKRLTEIRLKKGDPVEKALRRLKKKIDREGTLKVVRSHRHYEKPSERCRRKEKAARFSAMLSARHADM